MKVLQNALLKVLDKGKLHNSNRGLTKEYMNLLSTFDETESSYYIWSKEEDDWYQEVFVKNDKFKKSSYTYHERFRHWDAGLGQIVQVLEAINKSDPLFDKLRLEQIVQVLEDVYHIHPEVSSSVIKLLFCTEEDGEIDNKEIEEFIDNLPFLKKLQKKFETDQIEEIGNRLSKNINSRRGVATSGYPHLDRFREGIPNFYVYGVNIREGKTYSFTVMRSNDILKGLQLDVHTNLLWTKEIADKVSASIGSLSILSISAHHYLDLLKESIQQWLHRVTRS